MDKTVLLKLVNEDPETRLEQPVTANMLRDWVIEELMPQAQPLGRIKGKLHQNWSWNDAHLQRLCHICRIIKQGFSGSAEIRIQLWLDGIDVPEDLLKKSFKKEFEWWRKRRMRPIRVGFDPEKNRHMTERQQASLIKQMGDFSGNAMVLDPNLADAEKVNFLQLVAADISKTGVPDITSIENKIIENMGFEHLQADYHREHADLIPGAMQGLFAYADDAAGNSDEIIEQSTLNDLKLARIALNVCLAKLDDVNVLSEFTDDVDKTKDGGRKFLAVAKEAVKIDRMALYATFLFLQRNSPGSLQNIISVFDNQKDAI